MEKNKQELHSNRIMLAKIIGKDNKVGNLSHAQILSLVEKLAHKESSNRKNINNKFGYLGLFQFGADALVDVGFVNRDKLNKYKVKIGWGKESLFGQPQIDFLSDKGNWNYGLSQEIFLTDASLQGLALTEYFNVQLDYGKKIEHKGRTAITDTSSAKEQMGYISPAHLKGAGNATKLHISNIDSKDGNGTPASDYRDMGYAAYNEASEVDEFLKKNQVEYLPSSRTIEIKEIMAKRKSMTLLKPKMVGSKVVELQKKLNRVYPDHPIDLTPARFGAITTERVRQFQQERNLIADGIVGYDTASKLDEVIAQATHAQTSTTQKTAMPKITLTLKESVNRSGESVPTKAEQQNNIFSSLSKSFNKNITDIESSFKAIRDSLEPLLSKTKAFLSNPEQAKQHLEALYNNKTGNNNSAESKLTAPRLGLLNNLLKTSPDQIATTPVINCDRLFANKAYIINSNPNIKIKVSQQVQDRIDPAINNHYTTGEQDIISTVTGQINNGIV